MKSALLLFAAALAARAESLDAILARMDRDAKNFKSFSAKIKQVEYTAVLKDMSESNGEVRLKRGKNGVIGVEVFGEPDPRTIYLNGRTAKRYLPNAKAVEIYDAGKSASSLTRFVLLGFGSTSAELKKDYIMKAAGTETVNSTPATKIELTPRSQELAKMVTRIDVWIPEGGTNPIREKVYQPSKNYLEITYSDLKINPPLPDSEFELRVPAGTHEITPQK
jgi:outer membrane lipoprotein-sorting protein